MDNHPEAVVAGHICLDIIPTFPGRRAGAGTIVRPGALVNVGEAVLSTGGAVSNTGIALHTLGLKTSLMGKIGDDIFGEAVMTLIGRYNPALAGGMIATPGVTTSYSVVISPPGVDRTFLHCPGANDTFNASDVKYDILPGVRLFHFGYPPLMRDMVVDTGAQLIDMFQRVKHAGPATSLDMSLPDPDSESGRRDWRAILAATLPFVDMFLPSIDEILFMLDKEKYHAMLSRAGGTDILPYVSGGLLAELSGELLDMGTAIVIIKLGDQGVYLRTTSDPDRLNAIGGNVIGDPEIWRGRELQTGCFEADIVGTTGAGDATIAGFLAGVLMGEMPADAITSAVATGAFSVEAADSLSGLAHLDTVRARIRAGWRRRHVSLTLDGFWLDRKHGVRTGPNDKRR